MFAEMLYEARKISIAEIDIDHFISVYEKKTEEHKKQLSKTNEQLEDVYNFKFY